MSEADPPLTAIARRLHWLCGEIIARLEELTKPTGFDSITAYFEEIRVLSSALGFANPIIASVHVKFTGDQAWMPIPPEFTGGVMPRAPTLQELMDGIVPPENDARNWVKGFAPDAYGIQISDPTGFEGFQLSTGRPAQFDIGGERAYYNPNDHWDQTDNRKRIILYLKRWQRKLDGLPGEIAAKAHLSGQAVQDQGVSDASKQKPLAAKKRGRKVGTLKSDPQADEKFYTDWKASGASISEFCRRRGLDEEDVRPAIGRHRKRMPRNN